MDPVQDGQPAPAADMLAEAPKQVEDQNQMMAPLKMVFASERDQFPNKCYYFDGNPEMYTKDA